MNVSCFRAVLAGHVIPKVSTWGQNSNPESKTQSHTRRETDEVLVLFSLRSRIEKSTAASLEMLCETIKAVSSGYEFV